MDDYVVIMFRNGQLATQCSPQISAVYVTESGKISIDVIKGAVPADYDPLFKNNQVKLE